MGLRRKSRECVLQNLFTLELTGDSPQQLFYFHGGISELKQEVDEWQAYATYLFQGVVAHVADIDALIRKYSKHWKLERMGVVDRSILRMAIFELLYSEDVPKAVVINEAVEIAKMYGDKDSAVFINGNLDQVYKKELLEVS